MRKTIIVLTVLTLALALTVTGCANGTETATPPSEVAETSSNTVGASIEDEVENAVPDAEDAEAESSDDAPIIENPFAGIYRNGWGQSITITITDDGRLQYMGNDIDVNNVDAHGSIRAFEEEVDPSIGLPTFWLDIFPIGLSLEAVNIDGNFIETDSSRIRLLGPHSGMPDYEINVFYKTEPLKEGELSFLPTPGYTHEFAFDGIIGGTGVEWNSRQLVRFEDVGNGEIKRTVISATNADGEPINLQSVSEYIYSEDATGLYRRRSDNPAWVELLISYPIVLGETFGGMFTFVAVNETITTEAGTFENVVVIEDIDRNWNFYAPGVGHIRFEGTRSFNELISISN